jgi:hypothetical protein
MALKYMIENSFQGDSTHSAIAKANAYLVVTAGQIEDVSIVGDESFCSLYYQAKQDSPVTVASGPGTTPSETGSIPFHLGPVG